MDCMTNDVFVVFYSNEALFKLDQTNSVKSLLSQGYGLDEVLVETGFCVYTESNEIVPEETKGWVQLVIPKEAFSTHWEGSRFLLKSGEPVGEDLYCNPVQSSFVLDEETITATRRMVESWNNQCSTFTPKEFHHVTEFPDDEAPGGWGRSVERWTVWVDSHGREWATNKPLKLEVEIEKARSDAFYHWLKQNNPQILQWFEDWKEFL